MKKHKHCWIIVDEGYSKEIKTYYILYPIIKIIYYWMLLFRIIKGDKWILYKCHKCNKERNVYVKQDKEVKQ